MRRGNPAKLEVRCLPFLVAIRLCVVATSQRAMQLSSCFVSRPCALLLFDHVVKAALILSASSRDGISVPGIQRPEDSRRRLWKERKLLLLFLLLKIIFHKTNHEATNMSPNFMTFGATANKAPAKASTNNVEEPLQPDTRARTLVASHQNTLNNVVI